MRYGVVGLSALSLASVAGAFTVVRDVAYVSPGGTATQLDVFRPDAGVVRSRPTILFIHGGGWSGGDKRQNDAFCSRLADLGYSVVNANYTLASAGDPSFPQCVLDLKAVVRWIRSDGRRDFDLTKGVVVIGASAGGHLAQMVAVTSRVERFEPLPPARGAYQIQGLVSLWGLSDLVWDVQDGGQDQAFITLLGEPFTGQTVPLYRSASPINYVNECDAPARFYHGTADPIVPFQHSVMMADALKDATVHADLVLAPGAGHGFDGFGGQAALATEIAGVIPTLVTYTNDADFNEDGFTDFFDYDDFVLAFESGSPDADFNHDESLDFFDYDDFVLAFQRGC